MTVYIPLQVRDDEVPELTSLMYSCPVSVKGGAENAYGKVNILLQSYISKEIIEVFSLVSDMAYTAQVCLFCLLHTCLLVCLYTSLFVYLHTCLFVCTQVCLCVYLHVCLYTSLFVYLCTCLFVFA